MPVVVVSVVGALFGALVGGGSLWLIGAIWKRLRGVEAMGLGDVKMMFGVSALLDGHVRGDRPGMHAADLDIERMVDDQLCRHHRIDAARVAP